MEKTININGIEVKFKSSAALPRMYRIRFHKDIFVDFQKLSESFKNTKTNELSIESLEIFENLAYIMAKHADKETTNDIDEWLEQFETFDIYQILPELITLWGLETQQMSKPKK